MTSVGMQPRQAAGVINQGTSGLWVVGFTCDVGRGAVAFARVMSLVPDAR